MNRPKHYSGFVRCREARAEDRRTSFVDLVTCDRCVERIVELWDHNVRPARHDDVEPARRSLANMDVK